MKQNQFIKTLRYLALIAVVVCFKAAAQAQEAYALYNKSKRCTILALTFFFFLKIWGYDYTDSQGINYTYINSTTCYVDESTTSIKSSTARITIPSKINGRSVVKIGKSAFFYSHKLVSLTIPQTVTEIDEKAIEGCDKLTTIALPNSIVTIGKEAFEYCTSLKTITLSSNLKTIGDYVFWSCEALTSIAIPASVTSIGANSFNGCGALTSIKVETGNTVYDSRDNCNALIETATNKLIRGCVNTVIPSTVKTLSAYAFGDCTGLTSIFIPSSVTSLDGFTFHDCINLKTMQVDINNPIFDSRDGCNAVVRKSTNKIIAGCGGTSFPQSITGISNYAFYGCRALTTLTLPENIKNIDKNAFYYCTNLTELTIKNSSVTIGKEAFKSCDNLRTINSYIPNPTDINEDVFLLYKSSYSTEDKSEDVYNYATLYVPIGSKKLYQERNGWKKFKNIVEKFEVEEVSPADDLQAKLDAIALKNLPWYRVETIELPAEGVLVDKPLYVRNGCRAQLTGGPLKISQSIINDYCISIDNKSCLEFKNITLDFMRYTLDNNKYIFYNQGELGFEENVEYQNVPYHTNQKGECLIYCASSSKFESYNNKRLYTGSISVIKGEESSNIYIWTGELVSVIVPTIDGKARVVLSGKITGSGIENISIINAKEFQTGEGRHVINDFKSGATYINADIINLSYPDTNGTFEGGGKNIVIGQHAEVNGKSSVPELYLKKDAYITMTGSPMLVKWTLDADWENFTLEKIVVENVLSADDFEKMTFLNMPTDREAYYDENTRTVKLRARKVCDADDLLRFIESLSGTTTTNDDPAEATLCDEPTIDQDVDIEDDLWLYLYGDNNITPPVMKFYGGAINLKSRNSGWTFKGVGFTSNAGATAPLRAAGEPGGITSVGTLTFDGCTLMEGDYTVQNLSDGRMYLLGGTVVEGSDNLVNSGNAYLDGSVKIATLNNNRGGRIYVTSALQNDVSVRIGLDGIEAGVPIILGCDGYSLSPSDASLVHLILPDGYKAVYDVQKACIFVQSTSGISAMTETQAKVIKVYDTMGRKATEHYKGLRIQRMSDGTVKKVISDKQ